MRIILCILFTLITSTMVLAEVQDPTVNILSEAAQRNSELHEQSIITPKQAKTLKVKCDSEGLAYVSVNNTEALLFLTPNYFITCKVPNEK